MYEKGLTEEADEEKARLEQKQRDTRKAFEAENKSWNPQWFKNTHGIWLYKGLDPKDGPSYFDQRGKFSDQFDIFGQ